MDEASRSAAAELLNQTLERIRETPGLSPGDKVVAAMSGGIDSSVMAAMLHLAGMEVIGISMQLFDKTCHGTVQAAAGKCCTLDDFADAKRVANHLGFNHYIMNFESRFKQDVIDPFVASYLNGETPSPCILCNQHLKFNALVQIADEMGATFVATGHYARIHKDAGGYHLLKARDSAKDQSYFLFCHSQDTLERTLFPLESLSKTQVRLLAKILGLHLAEKPESQEICFVTQERYDQYIESIGADPDLGPGEIRHANGKVLGTHPGFWRFTVGQRKGIGIAHPEPLYVIRTDPATNTVWVGENHFLFQGELWARDVSWCREPSEKQFTCAAKLRSRSPETPATVEILDKDRVRVRFGEPQRAVTPGQAVVFYQGPEVLGGGWICSSDRANSER